MSSTVARNVGLMRPLAQRRPTRGWYVTRGRWSPAVVLSGIHSLVTIALLAATPNGWFVMLYLLMFTAGLGLVGIFIAAYTVPVTLWRREAIGYLGWAAVLAVELALFNVTKDRLSDGTAAVIGLALLVLSAVCVAEVGYLVINRRVRREAPSPTVHETGDHTPTDR